MRVGLNWANIVVAINGSTKVIKIFDTSKPECQKDSPAPKFYSVKDPIGYDGIFMILSLNICWSIRNLVTLEDKNANILERWVSLFILMGITGTLLTYRLALKISVITEIFVERFLQRGSRTIDQMQQGARSCKQNIVEGSAAAPTSKETEIKLTNVARASLCELQED